ncbi:unnamed protein product [Ilex paraguariensis]|uniref:NAC domain-containing protein n=1 Tax=Ilex paraguariensis TaxID=185542 RepID=A0ABC8SZA9_9AQUA
MVVPNVPVGYIFYPTERVDVLSFAQGHRAGELMFYLLCKAMGQPLQCNDAVTECDLYGQVKPMDLLAGSKEEVVYVFTKLKKKSENSSQIERKVVEKGTWSSVDNKKPVKFKDYVLCRIKKKKLPERRLSKENLEEPTENYQSAMLIAAGDDFEVAPLPYHESIQSVPLLLPQNEGYQLQQYTTNKNILVAASMSQSEEALAAQSGSSSQTIQWN